MATNPADRHDGTLPATHDGDARQRDQIAAIAIVATTAVAVVICRIWVASQAVMPKGPDVIGPWAAAFHISGAPIDIDMFDLPPYSIGLGALLAPLVRLIDDPSTRYSVAVALLGLSTLFAGWCMARFVRGSSNAQPLQQATAFCVSAAITAVAFSSTFSWSEPLALSWLCAWLALVAWSLHSPRPWPPLVVALFASTAPLVHGRVILIPVIWCIASAAIALAARRTSDHRTRDLAVAAGVVLTTAVGGLLSQEFRSSVVSAVWSTPNLDNDTQILTHLAEPAYWGAVVLETIGQLWYATTSTFGLAPIGVVALIAALVDRPCRLTVTQRRIGAVALVGLLSVWAIGVLFVANALTTPGPDRLDYLIYGRYGEPATIAFAAIGAAYLLAASRRHALVLFGSAAATLAATGVFTRWRLIGLAEARYAVNEIVISGVASFPLDRPGLDLSRWSAIGLAAIGAFALARLGGKIVLAVAITTLVLLGGVSGSIRAVSEHRAWDNSVLYRDYPRAPDRVVTVPVAVDALDGIAYSFNMPSQQYALANQGWQLQIVPRSSDELVGSLTSRDQMVVLRYTAGAPGDDWCNITQYDDIIVWIRTAIVSGEPGGSCAT